MISSLQAIPNIFQKFPQLFSELEEFFPEPQKLAIAVSGGSDSMFLSIVVFTFRKEKNRNPDQLFFLHCNHGIRIESKQEADFLSSFFSGYQLEIFERSDQNPANEESLRNRRYEQFSKYMQLHNISVLMTGHNLTDRIETSFLNLLRGCGVKGFLAMQKQASHHLLEGKKLIRPLLDIPKPTIQNYCE